MTPKMTALRNTLIVIGSGLATGFIVSLAFTYLTLMQAVIIFAVLALVGLAKMVYELELDKAKRLQELNNPKD
jgi:hypothetical protein